MGKTTAKENGERVLVPADKIQIPKSIFLGGAIINIELVERCNNNALGTCCIAKSEIKIAEIYDIDNVQSDESKQNTFVHEITHAILDTMGEFNLSRNEKFVSTFSSFLSEVIKTAKY